MNGERKSPTGPHVSAADRGLTLADGVFETMRAHGGVVFRLDRHLARLAQALAALDIPRPHDLRDCVLAAVRGANDAAVRLIVTRGIGAGGIAFQPTMDARPTVIVSVGSLPVFPLRPTMLGSRRTSHQAAETNTR